MRGPPWFFPAPLALAVFTFSAIVLVTGTGQGEDRASVRAMYLREPSTRVVQPLVLVSKDLPYGFDVAAHSAVDAITSPSIAQGNAQDEIHTEYRYEVGVGAGKTFDRTHVGLSVFQSREPDYLSTGVGLSLNRGVWENSGTVGVSFAALDDDITANGQSGELDLNTAFAGLSYDQALTPTVRAQLGLDTTYQRGYLGNRYRQVPNLGYEKPPNKRLRHAISGRIAKYFPAIGGGAQLRYRFYFDHSPDKPRDDALEERTRAGVTEPPFAPYGNEPWRMKAHTVEARLYKELGRDFELRLSYRYHSQGSSRFYCNSDATRGGDPSCNRVTSLFYSADEKLGVMATHMPELLVYWDLRFFARVPVLRWFSGGTAEVSYAHLFQSTHYGRAHFLQTGYTLPF